MGMFDLFSKKVKTRKSNSEQVKQQQQQQRAAAATNQVNEDQLQLQQQQLQPPQQPQNQQTSVETMVDNNDGTVTTITTTTTQDVSFSINGGVCHIPAGTSLKPTSTPTPPSSSQQKASSTTNNNVTERVRKMVRKAANIVSATKSKVSKATTSNTLQDQQFTMQSSKYDLAQDLQSPYLIPSTSITNIRDKVFDSLVYVIHCGVHNRILVARSPTNAVWLPFVHLASKSCWHNCAIESLPIVLTSEYGTIRYDTIRRHPPYEFVQLLEVFRLQMPQTRKFITRVVYYFRLNQQQSQRSSKSNKTTSKQRGKQQQQQFSCCTDSSRLMWLDLEFICNGYIENIWGPELVEYCRLVAQAALVCTPVQELCIPQRLWEFSIDEVFGVNRNASSGSSVGDGGGSDSGERLNSSRSSNVRAQQSLITASSSKIGRLSGSSPSTTSTSNVNVLNQSSQQQQQQESPSKISSQKLSPSSSSSSSSSSSTPTDSPESPSSSPPASISYLKITEFLPKSVKITEIDIERLYNDFLDHCYPSFYMTIDSFRHYMIKNRFETNEIKLKRLFTAFNYHNNGFLSFHEVLHGFVLMERDTPHEDFRVRFVFNYYDAKRRGVLFEEDFRKVIRDMHMDNDDCLTINDNELSRKTKESMQCFACINVQGRNAITYRAFLTAIGSHAFRGTSALCRSRRNIFSNISRRMTGREMLHKIKSGQQKNQPSQFAAVLTRKHYTGVCQSCVERKYKLANMVAILTPDGYYDRTEQLEQPIKSKLSLTESDSGMIVPSEMGSTSSALMPAVSLVLETQLFKLDNVATIFMRRIREFNVVKKNFLGQPSLGLMCQEPEQLYSMIKVLYVELSPILNGELRCKSVRSPVYVIGDIHGNLEDLISLERTIWRRFPCTGGVNYLFLGDYVDRGRWSVECALYLLSMKLLLPSCITMLRGNHEVRDIQCKYTYHRECLQKYGDEWGEKVWELTNRIFDQLPLCAVIDDAIYCAHGGIPQCAPTLADIQCSIPNVINNPEQDCQTAWEIMWSDPVAPEAYRDILETQPESMLRQQGVREGFAHNIKRGTAFYFSELAAQIFLNDNSLVKIIRAHEVPKWGFMFHFGHTCTTIFSCSHYCGNDNDCGVVLVDQGRMRIVRIDTFCNAAATDAF